jgi:hypothetical protein
MPETEEGMVNANDCGEPIAGFACPLDSVRIAAMASLEGL